MNKEDNRFDETCHTFMSKRMEKSIYPDNRWCYFQKTQFFRQQNRIFLHFKQQKLKQKQN